MCSPPRKSRNVQRPRNWPSLTCRRSRTSSRQPRNSPPIIPETWSTYSRTRLRRRRRPWWHRWATPPLFNGQSIKRWFLQVIQRIDDVSLMCENRIACLNKILTKPLRPIHSVSSEPGVPRQPQGGAPQPNRAELRRAYTIPKVRSVNVVIQGRTIFVTLVLNLMQSPNGCYNFIVFNGINHLKNTNELNAIFSIVFKYFELCCYYLGRHENFSVIMALYHWYFIPHFMFRNSHVPRTKLFNVSMEAFYCKIINNVSTIKSAQISFLPRLLLLIQSFTISLYSCDLAASY